MPELISSKRECLFDSRPDYDNNIACYGCVVYSSFTQGEIKSLGSWQAHADDADHAYMQLVRSSFIFPVPKYFACQNSRQLALHLSIA